MSDPWMLVADFLLMMMRVAEGSPLCCMMMCHYRDTGVGQNEATEPWDTFGTRMTLSSLRGKGSPLIAN